MRLEVENTIYQPADIVYPLVRDEMDKIVPYMPDIDRIATISLDRQEDGRVIIVNHWFSKPPSNIPSMVQKFAKPELFSWKDYATWKSESYSVDYRLESMIAGKLFEVQGTNYFEPNGESQTRVRITCNIDIYPERLPGVPGFLAKSVRPLIENIIRKTLEPNLSSLSDGLTRYFADPANRPG